ncbi:MAG: CoA ester lyase [Pseudomonadota bacterium]|nr:CoA ester lyase [Pseudomonadota bacterium]
MWRSLLFIPVLEDRFIAKAAERGADAIILDLEAGVADDRKAEARGVLGSVVARLSSDVTTTVRINAEREAASLDLDVAVIPGVSALHLALCEDPDHVRGVADRVSQLEKEREIAPGTVRLVAMLESPAALLRAREIATASPRMAGLTLGMEDYATAMGTTPNADLLRPACYQITQAARAAGIAPLAVPASMANFRDAEEMESAAGWARRIGAVGGYAVHPVQVEILNRVFAPSEEEIAWARRVTDAAAQAKQDGAGVFMVDGRMVDLPIITRARAIIDRQGD